MLKFVGAVGGTSVIQITEMAKMLKIECADRVAFPLFCRSMGIQLRKNNEREGLYLYRRCRAFCAQSAPLRGRIRDFPLVFEGRG